VRIAEAYALPFTEPKETRVTWFGLSIIVMLEPPKEQIMPEGIYNAST